MANADAAASVLCDLDDATKEQYQCTVCMDFPEDGRLVTWCKNGHGGCTACDPKVRADGRCPECRGELLPGESMRNRALERALASTHVACPNSARGCTHTPPLLQLRGHRSICRFELVPCPHAEHTGCTGGHARRGRRAPAGAARRPPGQHRRQSVRGGQGAARRGGGNGGRAEGRPREARRRRTGSCSTP